MGGALTFAIAARGYWLEVFPLASRELRGWRGLARAIPDPALRRDALFTHLTKSRHAEGLAAFAVLAPRVHRQAVVSAEVAYETIVDYTDTLTEYPEAGQSPDAFLESNLRLHRAFEAAVDLEAPAPTDYYVMRSQRDDGGYLEALVESCRAALATLPSYPLVRESLIKCARITAQAQSLYHALQYGLEREKVVEWSAATAKGIESDRELRWWEMIASGSGPIASGALMAAASDPGMTASEASRIEAAYFPWASILSTLLDCLVDLGDDPAGANSLGFYSSEAEAIERLAWIASCAVDGTRDLRRGELHRAIVGGLGGYYLAQPNVWRPGHERLAHAALGALGKFARPAVAVHAMRQGKPRNALRALPLEWGGIRFSRPVSTPPNPLGVWN